MCCRCLDMVSFRDGWWLREIIEERRGEWAPMRAEDERSS